MRGSADLLTGEQVEPGSGVFGIGVRVVDEELIAHGDYSRDSGAKAMRELLNRSRNIDAVFAANDLDDIKVSQEATPPLTTVRQPFGRISEEMVRLLLDVISGKRPAAVTIPTELVIRESA